MLYSILFHNSNNIDYYFYNKIKITHIGIVITECKISNLMIFLHKKKVLRIY